MAQWLRACALASDISVVPNPARPGMPDLRRLTVHLIYEHPIFVAFYASVEPAIRRLRSDIVADMFT